MARVFDEKLKILYILKILWEETDAMHYLTTTEIIEKLAEYGISAERKSVYRDLTTLCDFGLEIDRGHNGCCLYSRTFEPAELKLLVDAVQASRFISGRKSNDIIKKLSTLPSRYDAALLNRGVYVNGRPKTGEAAVIYTIDGLHAAINANHKVTFRYMEWTPDKKKKARHNGKLYCLSPWGLLWEDENYYLLAYDADFGGIKHFRVDKIADLRETTEPRQGFECFSKLNVAAYSEKTFGMFGGEDETVILEFPRELCGVIFDRFGTEITVFNSSDGLFSVAIPVKVSDAFLSWVVQFGGRIKITSPEYVCNRLVSLINKVLEAHV